MQDLDLQGHSVFREPHGQFLLAEGALGEVEEGEVDILFGGHNIPAISVQKSDGNDQSRAFIPVNEGLIAGDSEGIGRREPEDIWLI